MSLGAPQQPPTGLNAESARLKERYLTEHAARAARRDTEPAPSGRISRAVKRIRAAMRK